MVERFAKPFYAMLGYFSSQGMPVAKASKVCLRESPWDKPAFAEAATSRQASTLKNLVPVPCSGTEKLTKKRGIYIPVLPQQSSGKRYVVKRGRLAQ